MSLLDLSAEGWRHASAVRIVFHKGGFIQINTIAALRDYIVLDGFPKRPYFPYFMKMATRDEQLKNRKLSPRRNHLRLEISALILRRCVTSRNLHEVSEVRMFWKATTKFFKCYKVVKCRRNHLHEEKYVQLIFFVFRCLPRNSSEKLLRVYMYISTVHHEFPSS